MATSPTTMGAFLLQLIRDETAKGHFPTESELLEKIQISRPLRRYRYYFGFDGTDYFRSIMEEFRALGLIKQTSNQEDSGFPQWAVGDSWKPSRDGDNVSPPNPPGENAGGPGDGDGGGGMREVVSHPLLFALEANDFDELVNNLFPESDQNDR